MQAARGTPVAAGEHQVPTVPSRARARLVLALVAATLYAVDVVTKVLAVEHLDGRPDRPLVGDLLSLTLVRNPGAAFSTGTQYTVLLSCLAIAAVVVVCVLALRVRSLLWAGALGLLLAGVAGNLTDRLLREPGPLRGHVIDFLRLPSWPVFNIADVCINVAAGLILLQAFRGVHLDGTRDSDEPGDGPGDGPSDEHSDEAGGEASGHPGDDRDGERA